MSQSKFILFLNICRIISLNNKKALPENNNNNNNNLKFLSLLTLTVQNAVLGLSMRYARTRTGPMFLSSSGKLFLHHIIREFYLIVKIVLAVLMSEVVKLLTCLIVVFFEEGHSFKRFKAAINNTIVRQPLDTLKICVPSFVYIVQNNLLYLSASHLDAATYQVSFLSIWFIYLQQ